MSTAMLNSAETFSYFIPFQPFRRLSFLSPTVQNRNLWLTTSFLSLFSNMTFAMTTVTRIPLNFRILQFCFSILETFTLLFKIYWTSNYRLNATCLLNPFKTVFLLTTTFGTNVSFQLKPSLNWKLSVFSFGSFIFFLLI